ncbi:hypothetical protein HQ585_12875 [candidate division KSB1 bacterium]|nr:hypothetical protein [candidate division KSB1 bacterium]
MNSVVKPNLSTTGIGSVPFTDSKEAVSFLLNAGLSIPFWPQLPKRSFEEEMIPQYGKGMPCVRIDTNCKTVSLDVSSKLSELEAFYHRFLEEDPSLFAISSDVAAGLVAFQNMAGEKMWPVVKGQTTGPITLSTGIAGEDKRPLFSDPELRDAVVKTLVRQVQWQVKQLKPFASEGVLLFVDEPVLAAFGSSSYLYLSEEIVHGMLGEVFDAISEAGGITGIHVCGNSDFGMIVRSGVQVINFDAYQYGESISLYPDDIKAFFDRGGSIAWGIVPTTPAINRETVEGLTERLKGCFDAMERKGFSKALLYERAILTPSCGAGNLSLDEARRVFDLLAGVQHSARAWMSE